MPVFWFMFKVIVLLFGTVWVRASLPRLRYDQLMGFGWKFLIEIAFLWVMVSARRRRRQGAGLEHARRACPCAVVGALVDRRRALRCRSRSADELVEEIK